MFKERAKCFVLVVLVLLQHCANATDEIDTTTIVPEMTTLASGAAGPAAAAVLANEQYCDPSLCSLFNGTHLVQVPHIACGNNGSFGPTCGTQPHLLEMSPRRRQLILDMHNLARARVASGLVEGYKPAAHMPVLKWDDELANLAALHVKRCQFAHDQCHNTPLYHFSGQNIGIYWIAREFKSHSKRIKSFVLNWFREYRFANQTYMDKYYPHPDQKIGHFTMLASDRAHRVGCAAVRFRDPNELQFVKFMMTCNYDFTNIVGEPIYESGPTASQCVYKVSMKFPGLCDWKEAVYTYNSTPAPLDVNNADNVDDDNLLDNSIEVE